MANNHHISKAVTEVPAYVSEPITHERLQGEFEYLSVVRFAKKLYMRTAGFQLLCFYLSNEGVSLRENASHMGLPVPVKLMAVLSAYSRIRRPVGP